MTVNTVPGGDRRDIATDFPQRYARDARFEALDKSDVAELSATAINKMTRNELVRMIRVANLPALLRPDLDRHLPFYDHAVLTRLAHLARRCCAIKGQDRSERTRNESI
jgi:hypothetical protein